MSAGSTIVLCGGPLNPTTIPIGKGGSNAMVPLNGKPIIGWIFDDLLAKGIASATVVLRRENQRVGDFLDRTYGRRMSVSAEYLERDGTILESLAAGLDAVGKSGPLRVVLGDTLIRDAFDGHEDFIYAGEVEDTRRWCIVTTDAAGNAVSFIDKKELPGRSHLAVAGYYQFADGSRLRQCVADSIAAGETELSAALSRYATARPIAVRHAERWYDFGHIDNFTRARHELLQSRFFNSLRVNPVLNTITKVSTDNAKLEDELAWYLDIPEELKVLTPRIVSHRRLNGDVEIVQEYYGYPTLAELFVYADLPVETWRAMLQRVLRIHDEFRRHPGDVRTADMADMYVLKTNRRLALLAQRDPWWADQLAVESVVCDGTVLRNAPELLAIIDRRFDDLFGTPLPAVVHGDLCFSNVLFDVNNQIVRLIDPRGRFGQRRIHGDARYDIAKLRHSAHGLYDFIVADMFSIEADGAGVRTSVVTGDVTAEISRLFDCLLKEAGYDLVPIQVIEGLLFLSMLPLHHGHVDRQRMMYYTGLRLLNEVL